MSGHFERKFQGNWGVTHQRLSASEIWRRCLRDHMLGRFDTIPACDRHTDKCTSTIQQYDSRPKTKRDIYLKKRYWKGNLAAKPASRL